MYYMLVWLNQRPELTFMLRDVLALVCASAHFQESFCASNPFAGSQKLIASGCSPIYTGASSYENNSDCCVSHGR